MNKYFKINGIKTLIYCKDEELENVRQTYLHYKFMSDEELEKYSYNVIDELIKDNIKRIKYHIKHNEQLKHNDNILITCVGVCHYKYDLVKITQYKYQIYFHNEY